jgi:cullin-associated NEDD8-dissociated protein 1
VFSHKDQGNAAQTLTCQLSGTSEKGVGGRLADRLSLQGIFVNSFSLEGNAVWSSGKQTNIEVISKKEGAYRFLEAEKYTPVIVNITNRKQENIYAEEYMKSFVLGLNSSEYLGKVLEKVQLKTSPWDKPADDVAGLSKMDMQFRQVARLIKCRKERKSNRDLFFVQQGGFDMHNEVQLAIAKRWEELNAALDVFVKEIKDEQKMFDKVTIVTGSDFARTLTSNGKGTDHGWAANHFIMGGAVKGGKVYNKFPNSLLEGNDQDVSRGRLIPKYPWENVHVPIARWMGATSDADLDYVFPNRKNFNEALDGEILLVDELFRGYKQGEDIKKEHKR